MTAGVIDRTALADDHLETLRRSPGDFAHHARDPRLIGLARDAGVEVVGWCGFSRVPLPVEVVRTMPACPVCSEAHRDLDGFSIYGSGDRR